MAHNSGLSGFAYFTTAEEAQLK